MGRKAEVEVKENFTDLKENIDRKVGDASFICSEERANELANYEMAGKPYPLVKILKVFDDGETEEEEETKGEPTTSEEEEGTQGEPTTSEETEEEVKAKGNKKNTKSSK